jgi:hypothetical protein
MAARRREILDAVLARLEAILTADGFVTDAGANVHLGDAPPFGPDDAREAIVVVVEDDEPKWQADGFFIELPLSIQAVVATGGVELGTAYQTAEAILEDIKTAVELADRKLGGLLAWHGLERGSTRTLQREPGSEFVGVAVEYRCPYRENWGNP